MKTNMGNSIEDIELYIHIPFCVKKCNYCDFLSFAPDTFTNDLLTKEMYVNALCSEIEFKSHIYGNNKVTSIFIGGGTPSSLETNYIVKIMDAINKSFNVSNDAEITIECNPGTVNFESLSVYKSLGINRLSFGLQSTDDNELKALGRIHDYRSFLNSIDATIKAGFDNYNVDLMYGLPGQSLRTLRKSLSDVIRFNPKHLSVYSLIIEENTPFYEKYNDDYIIQCQGKITSFLPKESELCEMTDFVKAFLKGRGYNQYEISNYAKNGYECRHNIGYWTRNQYIGMGLGASSLYDETRYKNVSNIDDYIKNWSATNPTNEFEEVEKITKEESMYEYMILGLRMNRGVSAEEFYNIYGRTLENVYGSQIERLINRELLINDGNRIKPTPRGLELQNIVARDFLYSNMA